MNFTIDNMSFTAMFSFSQKDVRINARRTENRRVTTCLIIRTGTPYKDDIGEIIATSTATCHGKDKYSLYKGCRRAFTNALREARFTRDARFIAWTAWSRFFFPNNTLTMRQNKKQKENNIKTGPIDTPVEGVSEGQLSRLAIMAGATE